VRKILPGAGLRHAHDVFELEVVVELRSLFGRQIGTFRAGQELVQPNVSLLRGAESDDFAWISACYEVDELVIDFGMGPF
jgi:hypothetical protein